MSGIRDLHSDLSVVDGIPLQNPSEKDPDGHTSYGRRRASSGTGCGISDLDAPGTKTRPSSGSLSATPASERLPGCIDVRLEPHLITERFNRHPQKEVRSGEARKHSRASSEPEKFASTSPPSPPVFNTPGDKESMLLQPETRPISQEQLVNEVKGIYAGLVMVEKKCVEVPCLSALTLYAAYQHFLRRLISNTVPLPLSYQMNNGKR